MISALSVQCLSALGDDYKSLEAIVEEVRRGGRSDATREDISRCLSELAADRSINTYEFDSAKRSYIRTAQRPDGSRDQWFQITDKGRLALNQAEGYA
jgi:hypothetical protein